jgi:tetratricopeptide (TPR) repeat protein
MALRPDEPATVTSLGEPATGGAIVELTRGETLGRYIVGDRVGAGAMGVVYAAQDFGLGRKVALKLVREHGDAQRSARLLREAQVLALLSHPNIVTVYDVGMFHEQLFIALEFIQGQSAGEWLRARPRARAEIVDVFVQAGRGLAAAHAAGVIHRDFKPDNVLISHSGRVCVTDFGLARLDSELDDAPGVPLPGKAAPVTRTGAMLGTPAYMAPEQLLGESASAETDQFSFCVSLYEALYGRRPFGGTTTDELRARMHQGRAQLPSSPRIPSSLRRVLVRGLEVRPQDRFASMSELLVALTPLPLPRRRSLWLVLLALFAAGVAGAGVHRWRSTRQSVRCAQGSGTLDGIWNDGRKQTLRATFAATGRPFAGDAAARAVTQLDSYVARLRASRTDACEATWERRDQSAQLLDHRLQCLDDRTGELAALTDLFTAADATTVEHAASAVEGLGSIAACDDVKQLLAHPEATAPLSAAQAPLVTLGLKAKEDLAAGRYVEGLKLASEAALKLAPLHAPQLEARVLVTQGELEKSLGHGPVAEVLLDRATVRAEEVDDENTAILAWIDLAEVVGMVESRFDDAIRWAHHAEALLARPGEHGELAARLHFVLGSIAMRRDHNKEAQHELEQALAGYQKLGDDLHVAITLGSLGGVAYADGNQKQAIEIHRRALAMLEKTLGPRHPLLASVLSGLGNELWSDNHPLEALALFKRALALLEAGLGENHYRVALSLSDIAMVNWSMDNFAEAITRSQRALDIFARTLAPTDPRIAQTLDIEAWSLLGEKRYPEAAEAARRSLAIRTPQGAVSYEVGNSQFLLGKIALAQQHYAEALAQFRVAQATMEKSLPAQHPDLAKSLEGQGLTLARLGDWSGALPPFERALTLRQANDGPAADQLTALFGVARALWETHHDHARAQALARTAQGILAKSQAPKDPDVPRLADVTAWLSAHTH